MNQKTLSKWLKVIIIGAGICFAIVFFWILPDYGLSLVDQYPELSGWFWPWLILLWIVVIPCYISLVLGWIISVSIGEDKQFTVNNAKRLRIAAWLIGCDGGFFFIANIVFSFLGMNHPGIVILSLLLLFAAVAVAVVFGTLSHMVSKAAALQEQSDLTI